MKLNGIRVFIFGLLALFPFTVTGTTKTSIEPSNPKWGDHVRLIYNMDSKDAKIRKDQTVVASVAVWYPESFEEDTVEVHQIGDQLIAEWGVPESPSYVGTNFVTKDLTDGPISSTMLTRHGKKVRCACRSP